MKYAGTFMPKIEYDDEEKNTGNEEAKEYVLMIINTMFRFNFSFVNTRVYHGLI
jgi:hypothetical protein